MNAVLWFILFVGARGADVSAMEPKTALGPLQSLEQCAQVAALTISDLSGKHPDQDFRAACSKTNEIKRHPGEPLYDLRMLAAIAGIPFPQDRQ